MGVPTLMSHAGLGCCTRADAMATKSRSRLNSKAALWLILWQEQEPIGAVIAARQDAHGVAITGQLDLDV